MYTINGETGLIEKAKTSIRKEDVFVKEVMEQYYRIIRQRNFVSINAKKLDEEKNRIQINIKNAVEIQDLVVIYDSGSLNKTLGTRVSVDFIDFPISLTINYSSANNLNSARIITVVEMVIESPGDWVVDLKH